MARISATQHRHGSTPGLAYGLTENLELGLRRTNFQTDYEGYAKVAWLRQGRGRSPVSLAFQGGVSSIRDEGLANRTSWNAQVILGRRLGKRLSLLFVPTYVTRTQYLDPDEKDGTAAVGLGGELRLRPNLALTAEWIGQVSGVRAPYQSASLGLSIATSRHAFHLLVTNTRGTHTDLYAPGGDLDFVDGNFRLGFNISRTYGLR